MNDLSLARPSGRIGGSRRFVAAGALLLALVVGYFSYLNRGFQLDDALIYHRYVRNVLDGEGLVYNRGERLNALTSPLFTYLSIGCAALVGDVQIASTVVAGSLLFLALCVWWRLLSRLVSPGGGFLGALLAILFPFLFRVYGMETPLFLLLIAACLYFFETRQDVWLGVACGLLVLTRGEGILLLLPLAAEHLRQRRPLPPPRAFVAPVLMLAGHMLFAKLYFGAFLPHTVAAKIHQGRSGLWGPWPPFARVSYQIDWFFDGRAFVVLLLVLFALLGAFASRRTTLVRVGGAFLLLYTAFYVFLSLPNYHWYYAPYYMFGYAWAGVGIGWLGRRAGSLPGRLGRGLAITALVAITGWLAIRGAASTWTAVQPAERTHAYRRIGQWLDENAPPQATVAAMEIGMIGWYSRRHIIDIVGLVTPENGRLLARRDFDGWLALHRPDFVVTHVPEWRMERVMKAAVRRGEYRPLETPSLAGFRVLEKNSDPSTPGSGGIAAASLAGAGRTRENRPVAVTVRGDGRVRQSR